MLSLYFMDSITLITTISINQLRFCSQIQLLRIHMKWISSTGQGCYSFSNHTLLSQPDRVSRLCLPCSEGQGPHSLGVKTTPSTLFFLLFLLFLLLLSLLLLLIFHNFHLFWLLIYITYDNDDNDMIAYNGDSKALVLLL